MGGGRAGGGQRPSRRSRRRDETKGNADADCRRETDDWAEKRAAAHNDGSNATVPCCWASFGLLLRGRGGGHEDSQRNKPCRRACSWTRRLDSTRLDVTRCDSPAQVRVEKPPSISISGPAPLSRSTTQDTQDTQEEAPFQERRHFSPLPNAVLKRTGHRLPHAGPVNGAR